MDSGKWNELRERSLGIACPSKACPLGRLTFPITGLPVRPSHKMGFRSSAAKNGLPGEGRHEGLVPRNDVLTNGFI